jgi:hypothetical protein
MAPQFDSNLKRLMLLMNQSFEDCSLKVSPLATERLAEVVFQVMSARYRIFHNMEHIFSASEEMKGIGVFSALFHDIIYYQVDKRIHPLLLPYQNEFSINEKTNECILPELNSERWLSITSKIFGFKAGQTLNPFNGLNEFLSAVAAARMLSQYLSEWQTVQVITCIEATIPFRSQLEPDKNSFNLLRKKLSEVNQEYQLKASDADLDEAIKLSIALANRDISSFYSEDFGEFISGTWNLILENNPIFKNPLYTVSEYGNALQKVRGFFSTLKFENVVHEWGGFPSAQSLTEMKNQVSTNLNNAVLYLDLKLVEISILEVIANSTGGDAPYFLMIGESTEGSQQAPIERFFKDANIRANEKINETVFYVLKQGRKAASSFDFSHSPVAAYLYEHLNDVEVKQAIQRAQEFHANKIDGKNFLNSFRSEVIDPIIRGVKEISWSRNASL